MTKRILWIAFQYLLAIGLLTLVIYLNWGTPGDPQKPGLGDVWQQHFIEGKPVRWEYLVFGFTIYASAVFLTLIRWYLLVRAQGLQVTLPQAVRLGLIGLFYNQFLPGGVGGDIVKAAGLARSQERRTVAVATVLMDRVIALWGLVWFAALLGSVFWLSGTLEGTGAEPAKTIVTIALSIVGVSLLVWVAMGFLSNVRSEQVAKRLAALPRVGGAASEMWRAVWLYRCRQLSVWLTIGLSWICFVGYVIAFYCSARAFKAADELPSLSQHFLIVPIGLVIGTVPMFPGGLGINQLGYGGLYLLFSRPKQNGVLASIIYDVLLQRVTGVLGFVVYSFQGRGVAPATTDLPARTMPSPTLSVSAHPESLPTA